MFKKILALLIILGLSAFALAQETESLTITTYYPSPYGVYREMRAMRMAIGDQIMDGGRWCWEPQLCERQMPQDVKLLIEGKVGIGIAGSGVAAPQANLDVAGDLLVNGSTFRIGYFNSGASTSTRESVLITRDNALMLWQNGLVLGGWPSPGPVAMDTGDLFVAGQTYLGVNDGTIHGNVGIGTLNPNSSKGTGGYLDAKDVYLRDAGKWASESGAPTISPVYSAGNQPGPWTICFLYGSSDSADCTTSGTVGGSWTFTGFDTCRWRCLRW